MAIIFMARLRKSAQWNSMSGRKSERSLEG
jgi:hypothetical protein